MMGFAPLTPHNMPSGVLKMALDFNDQHGTLGHFNIAIANHCPILTTPQNWIDHMEYEIRHLTKYWSNTIYIREICYRQTFYTRSPNPKT